MGTLASLLDSHHTTFMQRYAHRLSAAQRQAIHAIRRCRTLDSGECRMRCEACDHSHSHPLSCGHRSCPQCQHHEATQWLDRQREKLLPVDYFMVTFTLPAQLRALAWRYQNEMYSLLFSCIASTLKDFGLNPKHLGADIGMTAILHTHTRRLDYHPHVHVVVPGGGVDAQKKQWKKTKNKFLFNAFALAKVFRARYLQALKMANLPIPPGIPGKWVVDCKSVGRGEPALKYLSRYLYRGVIGEKNIIAHANGHVTFRYREGSTGQWKTRTLAVIDFLWHVLQHVLPKGFRRVRDYGFLHGNAKQRLRLVQWVLRVIIQAATPKTRPVVMCPFCQSPMRIVAWIRPAPKAG